MNFEQQTGKIEVEKNKEKELEIKPPIIDIIRHGETEYKELQDPNFKLDVENPEFKLDAKHLDLTDEGIENIRKTAEKLATTINKENEVVILVASPQFRAMSSILIIEEVFQNHGIIILNSSHEKELGKSKGIKTSPVGLGQIPINEELRKEGFGKTWLEAHAQFGKDNPEKSNLPPAEYHRLVAETLGKELTEVFSKSHQDMDQGFKKFLRHIVNIEKYLQDETKELLNGKQLRIVSVTHEERLGEFAKEALNLDRAVSKAQLLEVRPEGILSTGKEIEASVRLFGKNDNSDLLSNVKLNFSGEGLDIKSAI